MAKPRTTPITKINTSLFTPRMIMQLRIGLDRYLYIKNNYASFCSRPYSTSDEFVDEYYEYYGMRAARAFLNEDNKKAYFELLKKQRALVIAGTAPSVNDIIDKISVFTNNDQASYASKLCHTANENIPVYDSRVREYLHCVYSTSKYDNADIDTWYSHLSSPATDPIHIDQQQLLDWFKSHPVLMTYAPSLTDVKILDAIIFTWHKYH